MKTTLMFLSVAAMAFLLALPASIGVNKVRAQQPPLKAYQVWTHFESTDGEPGDVYFARRSDGVSVRKTNTGITDLVLVPTGITIRYSDRNTNVMTRGSGKPKMAFDFKRDCDLAGLGPITPGDRKNILGFDTLHAAGTNDDGEKEQTHVSVWAAPALNCHPLEEEITRYRDGKAYFTETRLATKALIGDPPDDVFKIPQGIETPPSKFWSDLKMGPTNSAVVKRFDDRYSEEKAARERR